MMNKGRYLFLILIVLAGIGMIIALTLKKAQPPERSSFAPAYQLLGKPISTMNLALTRVVTIDSMSEQEYGDAIAERYEYLKQTNTAENRYVQTLLSELAKYAQKPLNYRIYVMDYPVPNAFALPGGVIIVTKQLLITLGTEGELVSILAHEMGHIERSHCLEAVRFKLLAKKIHHQHLGELADFTVNTLLRHTYSKTQEDEADEYAYTTILSSPYDPFSTGSAFLQLLKCEGRLKQERGHADVLRDYFMTHPPLQLRAEKFGERARIWWLDNPDAKRYRGASNLRELVPYTTYSDYPNEWRTANN